MAVGSEDHPQYLHQLRILSVQRNTRIVHAIDLLNRLTS